MITRYNTDVDERGKISELDLLKFILNKQRNQGNQFLPWVSIFVMKLVEYSVDVSLHDHVFKENLGMLEIYIIDYMKEKRLMTEEGTTWLDEATIPRENRDHSFIGRSLRLRGTIQLVPTHMYLATRIIGAYADNSELTKSIILGSLMDKVKRDNRLAAIQQRICEQLQNNLISNGVLKPKDIDFN